jgi:DNA repair protein RecO (recombination protein O)
MSLSGDAFILRTLSYSEADLIVHALSKRDGLLHFFVRGAKKSKKRFSGGVLQPPHLISFETNNLKPDQLESGSLITLKEASLIQDFADIRTDYKNMETMFSMIKVMLFSETGHEELFNHYGAALRSLPSAKNKKRFFTHFVVRYLYIEGVLPEQQSFNDFIRTPMGRHSELMNVSDQQIEKEVGLASHFLKSYSTSKEGIKWPS